MATIKRVVHVGDKPSKEAIEEVRNAKKPTIVYDEDSPELSDDDYVRMAKAAKEQRAGN